MSDTPLFGLEFFRAGDYSAKNKGVWRVDKEFSDIVGDFFDRRKNGESVPIFWSPNAAHGDKNKAKMGSVTNLQVKGDLLIADGYVFDEFRPLVKKRSDGKNDHSALENVSATFTADKKRLVSVCMCSEEIPEIKGLKKVYNAVFSDDDKGITIEFAAKKSNKETKMPDNMGFSAEHVKLKVIEAVQAKESELNITFSAQIAEKEKTIATQEERIAQLDKEIEQRDAKLLEFAENAKKEKQDGFISRIEAAQKAGKLTPAEAEEYKGKFIDFSENGLDKYIETDLEKIERGAGLTTFSGDRGPQKVDNVDEYAVRIPEIGEKVGEK